MCRWTLSYYAILNVILLIARRGGGENKRLLQWSIFTGHNGNKVMSDARASQGNNIKTIDGPAEHLCMTTLLSVGHDDSSLRQHPAMTRKHRALSRFKISQQYRSTLLVVCILSRCCRVFRWMEKSGMVLIARTI
ncbi:unnamed protein product [Ascophyllum nodosum]